MKVDKSFHFHYPPLENLEWPIKTEKFLNFYKI